MKSVLKPIESLTGRMPRLVVGLLCSAALIVAGPVSAQQSPALRPLGGRELAELSLSEGQRVDFALPDRLLATLEVPLAFQGSWRTLVLEPHSVRAPGFALSVPGPDGLLQAADAPAPRTLRGRVVGFPESDAAGSLVDGRLQLLVRFETGGPLWAIEPLEDGGHALYPESAVVGAGRICGTFAPHAAGSTPYEALGVDPGTPLKEAEIAIDADHEFYLLNSQSVSSVVADIENIIEQVRLIYAGDVGVSYTISSITVRTSSNDPYTTSNSLMLLEEFQDAWNATMTGVPRDVAHLFTGRPLFSSVIGVAYVGVICVKTQAYGLSESRYTDNLVERVALTAHELGHNWGSGHCGVGVPDCGIMCASVGGCPGSLQEFGTLAKAAISSTAQSAVCLTTVVEPGLATLTDVFPVYGRAGGGETLELHGVDLPTDVEPSVTLGGVAASVLSFGETLVTVVVPQGVAGTSVDVALDDGTTLTVLPGGYRYELEMGLGDRVTSDLTQMEVERFFFTGLADSNITVKVRPTDKLAGLISGLRVIGPGEQLLVTVGGAATDKGKPVGVKKLVLPASGEYRLEVFAVGITQGGYQMTTKGQPVKAVKADLAVSGSTPDPQLTFSADAGAELKLALFKKRAPKGDFALVDGEPSDLTPTVLGLTGPGGPVPIDAALTHSPKGTWARVKQLVLPDAGDYTLHFGALEDSVGHGKASAKIKSPKSKPQKYVLDP